MKIAAEVFLRARPSGESFKESCPEIETSIYPPNVCTCLAMCWLICLQGIPKVLCVSLLERRGGETGDIHLVGSE